MEKDTRRFALASVALGICAVTLFPVKPGLLARIREIHPGFSPAPFLEASRTFSAFDFAQNILLFLPVGFLTVADRSRTPWRRAALGAAVAFLFSAAIEIAQTRIPGRFPSFWDIGFNTLGGLLGASIYRPPQSGAMPSADLPPS